MCAVMAGPHTCKAKKDMATAQCYYFKLLSDSKSMGYPVTATGAAKTLRERSFSEVLTH